MGINMVLTPIFIEVLDLGVAGAAWATNIGMLVYSLVGYFYFQRGKASFIAKVHDLRFDQETFSAIAKLGFPGFILSLMGLVQAIVVFNAITHVGGEHELAFYAAANRLYLFLMTPLFGLMRALQPVLGINFGAKQYDRVKGAFWLFTKTGLWLVAPFWILMSIFPSQSLSLVLPDMQFTSQEIWYFRVYMLVLPALPLVFMALTYLPAIEQPKYATIIGMARQLVFYVPVMLLLPRWIGIGGVYYGSTAIDIVVTAWLAYIVWRTFATLSSDPAPDQSSPDTPTIETSSTLETDLRS
ncbi:MAG: MATE family efflux transporter [Bacteroidota bacterium]